jgi:ABC-type transporter MlaC component
MLKMEAAKSRAVTLRHHAVAALLMVLALLCAAPGTAAAGDSSVIVAAVHAAATEATLSPEERRARLRATVQGSFDLPALAQAVLRSRWQAAPEPDRAAFIGALGDLVADRLLQRLAPRSSAPFRIVKEASLSGGDTLVTSTLTLGPERLVVIDWRMRHGVEPRIVDIVVEGRSMVVSTREELARELAADTTSLRGITAALTARARRAGSQ